MPTAKLLDKDSKEVKVIDFKPTGKPLPRQIEDSGKKYQFEIRQSETYIYKELVDS